MSVSTRLFLLLAAFLSSQTWAQNLAIGRIRGDKDKTIHRQLSRAFCKRIECVEPVRGHATRADLRRAGIDFLLTAKIHGNAIDLKVVRTTNPEGVAWEQSFVLERKRIVKGDRQLLVSSVMGLLSDDASAVAPEVKEHELTSISEHAAVASDRESTPSSTPVVEAELSRPDRDPAETWPVFMLDLGLDVVGRNFGYQQLTAGNLVAYQTPYIPSPRLDLALYPFAHSGPGLFRRLGLDGEFAYAVGLQSQLGSSALYPTKLSRIDGGLALWLGSDSGLSISPQVGVRQMSFSTGTASDGSVLTTLPNVAYTAVRVSAALRYAVTRWLGFDLRLSGMPVIRASGLIDPKLFSQGTGLGLESEGGFRVQLSSLLGVGVFGEYTRYAFSFSPRPTDAYQAKGATDAYYGGRAAVTLTY